MKNKKEDHPVVSKVMQYVDEINLHDVNDTRFRAIVDLAKDILRIEKKEIQVNGSNPEGPSEEVLNFINSVEEAVNEVDKT